MPPFQGPSPNLGHGPAWNQDHFGELETTPGRLRKKGIPQPAPSLSSLPAGREVKESSHLLCRVRNRYIRPGPQESFFSHPAGAVQTTISHRTLRRDIDKEHAVKFTCRRIPRWI